MSMDSSFALVMSRLRAGDEDAATEVFRRFVHRLIALASGKLDNRVRSKEDPEDVVLSVLKSFFLADERAQFELTNWEGLWALLAKITVRKCIDRGHFWTAGRRDVGREFAPPSDPSEEAWREAIARGPTAEQAVVLAETIQFLVEGLLPTHRSAAELYFQGYSHLEISELCGISERTVGRVIEHLREKVKTLESAGPEG